MEPMQWLTLIVFGLTILAVITNVIDSTLAALLGVARDVLARHHDRDATRSTTSTGT